MVELGQTIKTDCEMNRLQIVLKTLSVLQLAQGTNTIYEGKFRINTNTSFEGGNFHETLKIASPDNITNIDITLRDFGDKRIVDDIQIQTSYSDCRDLNTLKLVSRQVDFALLAAKAYRNDRARIINHSIEQEQRRRNSSGIDPVRLVWNPSTA